MYCLGTYEFRVILQKRLNKLVYFDNVNSELGFYRYLS